MAFKPQTQIWPGTRAVLMVHGIGDASAGGAGAFPLDDLKAALGDASDSVAFYTLNYDFINDWIKEKVNFKAGITALKQALKAKFGSEDSDGTTAEYAGDVLWPVLSADLRLAVREAYVAQLQQIQLDRGESALAKGDDPLDYQISIIAHSLGCFHTYEVLAATAAEGEYHLRPASDLFTLDTVILMASPVKLVRSVGGALLGGLVPDLANLATIAQPLAIPSETRKSKVVACATDFVAITGTQDPVGGHLLGKRLDWAYMDIPGQHSIIVSQQMLDLDTSAGTAKALAKAFASGGPKLNNPHSWSAYIVSQAKPLRGYLLA